MTRQSDAYVELSGYLMGQDPLPAKELKALAVLAPAANRDGRDAAYEQLARFLAAKSPFPANELRALGELYAPSAPPAPQETEAAPTDGKPVNLEDLVPEGIEQAEQIADANARARNDVEGDLKATFKGLLNLVAGEKLF